MIAAFIDHGSVRACVRVCAGTRTCLYVCKPTYLVNRIGAAFFFFFFFFCRVGWDRERSPIPDLLYISGHLATISDHLLEYNCSTLHTKNKTNNPLPQARGFPLLKIIGKANCNGWNHRTLVRFNVRHYDIKDYTLSTCEVVIISRLCAISTGQLELLLWRARPDSPTHPQDCTFFYTAEQCQ